jgi:hypothetical protein
MTLPSTPAPAASRALSAPVDGAGRAALFVAIASAPVSAIASAVTYLVLGVFDVGEAPTLPQILVAVFTGIAVTMFSAAVVVVLAKRAGDDARGETALNIVVWAGTLGTAVGGAVPIAIWVASHL